MAFLKTLRSTLEEFRENDRVKRISAYLPPLNFISIHYTYFVVVCLISSLIFWGSSDPSRSISYTDSLFLVVSAMTEAGLNTVNLSQMTTFQQVILWLLIIVGSSIWVSVFTVLARKRAFESRFKDIVRRQKQFRRSRSRRRSNSNIPSRKQLDDPQEAEPFDDSSLQSRHSIPRDPSSRPSSDLAVAKPSGPNEPRPEKHVSTAENGIKIGTNSDPDHVSYLRYVQSPSESLGPERARVLSFAGVGAEPHSTSFQTVGRNTGIYSRGRKRGNEKVLEEEEDLSQTQYPGYLTRHTTGRNAQFFDLTRAEREHLGGVEYRAITLLAYVVPIYFILWQLLGCLALGAYMNNNKASVARENGIDPWWLGIFNGASAFNNSGMSLLDANMIPFQKDVYPVFTMGLMILAGNTAYPLFLRLILWTMLKIVCLVYPSEEHYADHKATIRFVLKYPRRVYTNLFPSAATWWLFFCVILLNGIDWAAFELLNIGNSAIEMIEPRYRVLDGLFQALAVRSGGFYIVAIPTLRIGLQVLYVIMMYISVYPVVITMRHSNVYEERSLGIYADDPVPVDAESGPKLGNMASKIRRSFSTTFSPFTAAQTPKATAGRRFLHQQVRGQLSHDLWWLVLAVLFIACIEVANFERDPVTYSVFNIAFEVVSGYGCVGISTGLPNEAYSFSGGWHVCSKLILIAVMLRGRHRGLPVALDRAVRLPHGEPGEMEEEDMQLRRSMSGMRANGLGLKYSVVSPQE